MTQKAEVTVEQLIEFLKTQDLNAIVQIVEHSKQGTGYYEQGGYACIKNIDLEKHVEYDDFSAARAIGETYLLLGVYDG